MDFTAEGRAIVARQIEALQAMENRLGDSFADAVRLLDEVLEKGGRLVVVGVGKSGNIGRKLAATFNSTGAPCTLLNAQDALHGDLGLIRPGDVVLALSHSGETRELLDLVPHLRTMQTRIVAITGGKESSLARLSDVVLDASIDREACPLGRAPTSSTTVALVLGDALAMVLLQQRSFGDEDFARLHPGGSLGHALLLRVSDIMRGEGAYPLVAECTVIREVLGEMSRLRCGAAAVAREDGTLAGVFTHGDFVRGYREDIAIGEARVGDHMTADPVTILLTELASEIRQVLEARSVDDIVVVDGRGCPAGLVDTVDLSRLGI